MLENNKNAVTVIYSGGDIQVPFLFFDEDDLVVLYELTPKVLGTDYTVTGSGNEAGGMVLLTVPPANGTRVTVIRKVEFTQLLQIPPNGIIPEGALNRVLDRIVMMIQQLAEQAERAVTYPEGTDKGQVANAGEMLDSIEKARTDINNAVSVAGTTLNTANEKLGEINTVSAEKLQDMTEKQQAANAAADRAKAEADRAQPLPIGQVIHGFWKTAPAGTLALVKAQWPIAGFPDLWNKVLAESMAVPKVTYDAIKAEKGSVGFYGIDDDGVSFWTPHLEDIAIAPAALCMAGFETGDIKLASLPEIAGSVGVTDGGSDSSYTLLHPYAPLTGGQPTEGAFAPTTFAKFDVDGGTNNGVVGSVQSFNFDFKASRSDNIYGYDGDSEVRTKRVHLLYCVVAYDTIVPTSVAEVSAMLASITQLQTDVQELQQNVHALQDKKVSGSQWLSYEAMSASTLVVQPIVRDGWIWLYGNSGDTLYLSVTDSNGVSLMGQNVAVVHTVGGQAQSILLPVRAGMFVKLTASAGTPSIGFIPAS